MWRSVARGILAMIGGYGLIVLLTSLGFNVWLQGEDLYRGGPVLQLKGTIVAVVAGLSGGFLAAVVGGTRPISHSLLVLIPLTVDTIFVLFWFDGAAPLWFDAIGSATLMVSTIAGGILVRILYSSRERRQTK